MTSLDRPTATSTENSTTMNTTTTTTTTTTTSTTTTATPGTTATTTTTTGKKKFGKNLNKLTKPPAAPAPSESSKTNAASRNGLLLLSTNKRSSGSGPSNGLLSSKPNVAAAPLPSLGLQYESTTSTHDVLLGAVVGAAASRSEQTPDAWGVAAAANNSSKNNVNKNDYNTGDPSALKSNDDDKNVAPPKPEAAPERHVDPARDASPPQARHGTLEPVVASANWDEYGGRGDTRSRRLVDTDTPPMVITAHHGTTNDNRHHHGEDVDSQQVYMSKLARERAERRRQEEANRSKEQKEKAAQRLRALESKMEEAKGVVLEPLGSGGSVSSSNNNNHRHARPATQRTLYDPNNPKKSYSSLVGGSKKDGKQPSNAMLNNSGASVGSRSRDEQPHRSSVSGGENSPNPGATPGAYSGPVIHLNSYEDRDRGEAPRAAAPRMLFDPKSGSMVAVPSRDENPRGGKNDKGKGRRGRGKKDTDDENTNSRGKKDKAKKVTRRAGKNLTKGSGKTTIVSERKLPRTRGVLYAYDDKGNIYCADGCDADLGYGAHSVPGGRARNPEGYAKYVEEQERLYNGQMKSGRGRKQQLHGRSVSPEHYHVYHQNHGGYNPYAPTGDMAGFETGYDYDEPEQPPVQFDLVKPDEKIELVTGMDDESPTLQATAREFAPSQAALAAAAQAATLPSLGSLEPEDEDSGTDLQPTLEPGDDSAAQNVLLAAKISDEEEEDDAEEITKFIGLGFGPTENMDSVIQSHGAKDPSSNHLDGVDFVSFGLNPPLAAGNSNSNSHNHIFAFGTSSTWGTGGDSNDWSAAMLAGGQTNVEGSALFGGVLGANAVSTDEASPALDDDEDDHDDDAFLSLTTGIPGLLTGGGDDEDD